MLKFIKRVVYNKKGCIFVTDKNNKIYLIMKTITKEMAIEKLIKGGVNPSDARQEADKYFDRAIQSGFKSLTQICRYINSI